MPASILLTMNENEKRLLAALHSVTGWIHKGHDSKPMSDCKLCKQVDAVLRYHSETKNTPVDPALYI